MDKKIPKYTTDMTDAQLRVCLVRLREDLASMQERLQWLRDRNIRWEQNMTALELLITDRRRDCDSASEDLAAREAAREAVKESKRELVGKTVRCLLCDEIVRRKANERYCDYCRSLPRRLVVKLKSRIGAVS